MSKRALVIVDVQHDFLPGGALGVEDGNAIIPNILRHAREGNYDVTVTTQDWHPGNHVSFAKGEPEYRDGSWPAHCVAGTPGAELHPDIEALGAPKVRKGYGDVEAYSGFDGALSGTRKDGGDQSLADYLRDRGITDVDVVGIATDYCVKATAIDAAKNGFETRVLLDSVAGVAPESTEDALYEMSAEGVIAEVAA